MALERSPEKSLPSPFPAPCSKQTKEQVLIPPGFRRVALITWPQLIKPGLCVSPLGSSV